MLLLFIWLQIWLGWYFLLSYEISSSKIYNSPHFRNQELQTPLSLDTKECWMLGVECPEKPEIFDFTVFRGSSIKEQIKDLHFFGIGWGAFCRCSAKRQQLQYTNQQQYTRGSFLALLVRMTIFIYWRLRKLQTSYIRYQISHIKKGTHESEVPFLPLLSSTVASAKVDLFILRFSSSEALAKEEKLRMMKPEVAARKFCIFTNKGFFIQTMRVVIGTKGSSMKKLVVSIKTI